jgi:hypothetical protein
MGQSRFLRAGFAAVLMAGLALSGAGCSSSHMNAGPDTGIALPDGGMRGDGSVLPGEDGGVLPGDDGGVLPGEDGGVVPGEDGGRPPRDAGMVATVGTLCETDEECPGLFCSTAGSGFGYCSWICAEGMPCPGDSVCAIFSGGYGYCMSRCDPGGEDCETGYLCQPGFAEAPVCYPGCGTDADCPAGLRCGEGVSGTRQCYTPDASVGQECERSEECPDGGYCLDEGSWGAPRGLCVTFCDLESGFGCDSATTCVAWGFSSGAGSCIPTCDAETPCRPGYACVATEDGTQACVARCTRDSECSAGHSCNFVTGRCGG